MNLFIGKSNGVVWFALIFNLLSVVFGEDFSLPYYHLQVCQKLIYETQGEFQYTGGGSRVTKSTLNIWIVNQNMNGTWRLILRQDTQKDTSWTYCDLSNDGSLTSYTTLGSDIDISAVFIPLPKDSVSVKEGWEYHNLESDEVSRFTIKDKPATDSNILSIQVSTKTSLDGVYGLTYDAVLTYDIEKRLITYKEGAYSMDYGPFAGKGTFTTELKSIEVEILDAVWVEQFIRELEVYSNACKDYWSIITHTTKQYKELDLLLSTAEMILKEALNKITILEIRQALTKQIDLHTKNLSDIKKEETKIYIQLVDKPAAGWKAKDLNGKIHSLKQYRGKVILLDFWYRGCPSCIKAMPLINRVVEYFKDKPVAFFGMNTDSDEEDARFVAEKLKLLYPTPKAEGIDKKYKATVYPTFIIIDQKGIVREIHHGYSLNLYNELVEVIESLLKE